MGHEHHDHGHHHHDVAASSRAFAVGVVLNLAFVVVSVVAGIRAHSTALLADAAHNLGDVLGLAMAWGATVLAQRQRTARRTYGLKRSTIVAALVNAMIILFAVGGVSWEAVQRLTTPHSVDGGIVAVVAAIGVAINGIAAMLFAKGRDRDLNVRGAFLHLVADAAVSAGVVISGVIVWRTGWSWIDPIASLGVSIVILIGTLRLLREAADLLLDAVPLHIDPDAVSSYLAALPEVCDVHDLHIWSMSTTEVAMTAHLVVPWAKWSPQRLRDVAPEIEHRFGIGHVTIQLEPDDQAECRHAIEGAV
jgi:cobalt-zinc-cadmium efflux system protein